MRGFDIPGGWHCDARPDGRFAAVMPDRVVTDTGDIPLPDGARPLYLRVAESGPRLAGQHERSNRALEWDGEHWAERSEVACGTSSVIYDRDNMLHAADCAVVGVNGYRYIADNGDLVTGDATYGPTPDVPWICEWTYLGDGLYIGQGQPWGIVLWEGQHHRVLIPPDGPECRFIRARRAGDLVSLSWYSVRGDQYISHFRWPTVSELRALPVYRIPAPAPSPGPGTPNPEPNPQPAPMPTEPLTVEVDGYTSLGTAPMEVTVDYRITGAGDAPVRVELLLNGLHEAGTDRASGRIASVIEEPGEYRLKLRVTSAGRIAETGMPRMVRVDARSEAPVPEPPPPPPAEPDGDPAVHLSRTAATDTVRLLYLEVLEREPDPEGLAHFVDSIMVGALDSAGLRAVLIAAKAGGAK